MSFRRDPSFMLSIREKAAVRVKAGVEMIRQKAVDLIEEPKSGQLDPGDRVPSGQPGNPPADQTGELKESLKTSPVVVSQNAVSAHVFTELEKGRVLEGGTADMEPRPYLRPALAQSKNAVVKIVAGGR